jgi:SRSO17 transposase
VSISLAHEHASLPVAYRLYLPEAWAQDRRRRRAAGVPDTVAFRPKWQIALEQITQLTGDGVPAAPVVADAGYGVKGHPILPTRGHRNLPTPAGCQVVASAGFTRPDLSLSFSR